ncbi:methyltransferase domain-containing protein [Nonomuraea pusilla]|uniref:Methyltransferase domain-containing protein n=1 Tax=Nonomuraea pusilla TaxID=46177 RepID=A0A1H8CDV7_9ACTN|nr:methyltransferase domain-containing protein [Nonomuraea pusilla]SEM92448.1 Methyltransferase domain-containing protein [Nonomuraea pusilla]
MPYTPSVSNNGHEPEPRLEPDDPAYAGQAAYTPFFLKYVYDPLVVRFQNRFTWRCPSRAILGLYHGNVSDDHLDVGPGTGWYLNKCRFPSAHPRIALLDVNIDVLSRVSERIARYHPQCVKGNLLKPLPLRRAQFDSVGLVHVLHCLPGSIQDKAQVFDQLAPLLRPKGRLFGSTILSLGVPQTRLSRSQLGYMNKMGIFANEQDSLEDLENALAKRFTNYKLHTRGSIALFSVTV